jgi:hypothetical protein
MRTEISFGIHGLPVVLLLACPAAASELNPARPNLAALTVAQSVVEGTAQAQASTAADQTVQPPVTAPEPAPRVKVGFDLVAASAFVWRGFVLTPSLVVQPNMWVKVGDFTVTSWGNVARHGPNGKALTEHDLVVAYSKSRRAYTFSAGWINYVFLDLSTGRVTNELYVGVNHASYFSPAIMVYQDLQEGSGTYISAASSHAYTLRSNVVLTPSLAVGYNHNQWIDASTFSDATVGVKLAVPTPIRHLAVAPFANYSISLNREMIPHRFFWGVSFSVP